MTREEAINILKEHIDTYVVCHGQEDNVAISIDNVDVEAFHVAIKALEKKPSVRRTYKERENTDWSGAQGNTINRIKEEQERGQWGIYG